MVSTSKILTVSYGTFSCTLEGFDDSFDTMKAIAEYFRDLAADDRYFGAEPPTPDSEMLARIAEREISRRVEAHEDQGKIVLRAETDAAPVTIAEVDEEPETPELETPETALIANLTSENDVAEFQEPVDDQAGSETEEATPIAPVEEPVAVEPALPSADEDDSVAARLRRIRSVVANSSDEFEKDFYSEDEHAQDFLAETAANLDLALAEDDAAEASPADPDLSIEDFFEGTKASESEEVAQPEVTSEDVSAYNPDAEDEETIKSLTAGLSEEEDEADLDFEIAEFEASGEDETDEDTLSQLLADAMPEESSEPEEVPVEAAIEELADIEQEIDSALELKPEDQVVLQPSEEDVEDPSESTQKLRARVIKMRRSDFEAAISDGQFETEEDYEDVDEAASNIFDDAESFGEDAALSPEEEAELQSELAAVEAEMNASQDASLFEKDEEAEQDQAFEETDATFEETEIVLSEDAEEAKPGDLRRATRLQEPTQDKDVSRLFNETDTQLEAPETSQRRNAIQHLRAAVSAAKAEKKSGNELLPENDQDPYRSDLESVVRPRTETEEPNGDEGKPKRPRTRARTKRPIETRPAPLKLVAEQRIDTERDPVRPRRVSSRPLEQEAVVVPTGEGSFSAFAEKIGATTMPELLEAAAAYMSDVEGRDQFSRPMLMGKLKEVEIEAFSREDGLRSFGQLLRTGKIQKLKGGRFAVTDQTEYRNAG